MILAAFLVLSTPNCAPTAIVHNILCISEENSPAESATSCHFTVKLIHSILGVVTKAKRNSGDLMSFANLKDELKIGIESLDQEHRELIGIMEELSDAFDNGVPALDVSDLFGALYDKASAHFTLEERLMREKKYPLDATHKADHRRLLERVRDMMDAYEAGMCTKCDVNFSTCIESWFVTHVTEEDTRLRGLDKSSGRRSVLDRINALRRGSAGARAAKE